MKLNSSIVLVPIILIGLAGCSDPSNEESTPDENEISVPENRVEKGSDSCEAMPHYKGEEMSEDRIREMAERFGIDTDGKTIEEIKEEIKRKKP